MKNLTEGDGMRWLAVLTLVIVTAPSVAVADEASNINACTDAAKAFAGVELDSFDARYEGSFWSMNTVRWSNAECEVKLDTVLNLVIEGEPIIIDGFAGPKAKALYQKLDESVRDAVSVLRTRISLLEARRDEAYASLTHPHPNLVDVEVRVQEAIDKSK